MYPYVTEKTIYVGFPLKGAETRQFWFSVGRLVAWYEGANCVEVIIEAGSETITEKLACTGKQLVTAMTNTTR